jgi:hypothetical protein
VTHLLDSDTAMRVGLRRQLADLAECRDQAVGRVVALDRMIADVRLRLEQAEAKR